MKVGIVGTGYVGLTTGISLASKGHDVVCLDVIKEKVDMINKGEPPIYEKGMKELLNKVLNEGLFKATLDPSALNDRDVIFICVGTPSKESGEIDLKYIKSASETVGQNMKDGCVVVVKSTVVPGTTVNIVKPIVAEYSKRFEIAMNPEFLKEGNAIEDFLNGDRIVIGAEGEMSKKALLEVYKEFPQKKFITNPTVAEMIKYVSNSLLATKISFANEMGNLCKRLGIDSYEVMDGVGLDKRISRSFLNSGAGFGGSCFPKDVKAIIHKGEEMGESMELLKSVIDVNKKQPLRLVKLLKQHVNLQGAKIGIFGLAFKPGTDDIREAPSLIIIDELLKEGAKVLATDPEAIENVRKVYGDKIEYVKSAEELSKMVDTIVIITDWKEYKDKDLYNGKIVIDGRRILEAKESAKKYEGICW